MYPNIYFIKKKYFKINYCIIYNKNILIKSKILNIYYKYIYFSKIFINFNLNKNCFFN